MYVAVNDSCQINPCLNGATCNVLAGGYTCTCTASYTGTNCETGTELGRNEPGLNNLEIFIIQTNCVKFSYI
jgi:hypothetical protein